MSPNLNADRYRIDSNPSADQASPIRIDAAPRPCLDGNMPESRYEIRFSASEGFLRKLKRAQAICSRRPGLEAVLEKALDELLERHDPERREARREKRKSVRRDEPEPVPEKNIPSGKETPESHDDGDSSSPGRAKGIPVNSSEPPRAVKTNSRSRHIPAGIRDAVFRRDDGRCTYVGKNGVRCGATVHLQIDHIRPFCRGGKHTIDNLRLLCGKHNRLAARKLSLLT